MAKNLLTLAKTDIPLTHFPNAKTSTANAPSESPCPASDLQQSGEAFYKSLPIMTHSCMMIWGGWNDYRTQTQVLKALLIRISGRDTKKKPAFTAAQLESAFCANTPNKPNHNHL